MNEGFVKFKAMIKRLLDEGKETGDIREDVNTEIVSEMIFAGMLGASVIYGTEKSEAVLDRCIEAFIDYLDSLRKA